MKKKRKTERKEITPRREAPIRLPGSLSYTGRYTDVRTVIEMYSYDRDAYTFNSYERVQDLPELTEGKVHWINIIGLNEPAVLEYFGRRFAIHEMHLEDIAQISRHSKVEIEDHYLMSEHYMIYIKQGRVERECIVLFLLKGVVLTFQEQKGDVFDPIRERIRTDGAKVRSMGDDYLYYLLVDRLVDEASFLLNDLVYQLDEIEAYMVETQRIDMNQVYAIKRELLNVKTAVYPLDGLIDILLSEKNQVLSDDVITYMEDVEDHVDQTIVDIERANDTIDNLNTSNMTELSNQMNNVMKVLAIFSAIFIPLNFITGMYGMNFRYMPYLDHPYAFFFFVGISLAIVAGLIYYFKKKKWF